MRHRLFFSGGAILAFAIVVGACAPAAPASPSTGTGQPKRGGTLVLARSGEVTNLDPHKVPAFTSARVFELVYSYLMRLDDSLGVQPDLAASMPRTSPDGKRVTVELRKGVKFQNGDPLTSADVKYTFDRIIDPKTAAVARSFFTDVDTITAPDDATVIFNLKNPNAALLAYMAHPNTGIVSKKIGEANAVRHREGPAGHRVRDRPQGDHRRGRLRGGRGHRTDRPRARELCAPDGAVPALHPRRRQGEAAAAGGERRAGLVHDPDLDHRACVRKGRGAAGASAAGR